MSRKCRKNVLFVTPGALSDLRDRRLVVPLLDEEVDSCHDKPLAGAGFPADDAVGRFGSGAEGVGTPWIPGRPSTESDPLPTDGPVGGRSLTVNAILALASSGVRTSAIRLPRTVHALDAATLFRLALEQAPAGSAWHAVADEGDQVRDIAAVIGRRLAVPVESVPTETLGPLGPIFATDQPASSHHTRQALGWEPTHPSLLHDLELIEP